MAKLIDLKTFSDKRGNLTVIEKVILYSKLPLIISYEYVKETLQKYSNKLTFP